MFSPCWPRWLFLTVKALALGVAIAAAVVGWWAARLWSRASKVAIDYAPPRIEVSYDDNPGLGVLETQVSGYATQAAYNTSSAINADAAQWTGWAAMLTGLAAVLGAL